jgi:hypothetical protein
MMRSTKKALKDNVLALLVLIVSTLASLYCIEAYLRYAFHISDLVAGFYPLGNSVASAKIKMVQREYSINLDYNNQGFRDKEFSFKRGEGERRILFLGDSFVEGTGVSVEKRASNLIQAQLQKKDSRFNVINAAQLATNPITYFENFIQFGVALKPELIVVGVFIGNDFQNSRAFPVPKNYSVVETYSPRRPKDSIPSFFYFGYLRTLIIGVFSEKELLVKSEVTDKFWDFYFKQKVNKDFYIKKSNLPLLQYETFEKLLSKDVVQDFYDGKLNPSYFLSAIYSHEGRGEQLYDREDLSNVVSIMSVMNDECIRRGIKLVVVTYPDIFQLAPGLYSRHLLETLGMFDVPKSMFQLKDLRLTFLSELEKIGITHIDLTSALSISDYYLFDGHLNEGGQAVAAKLIYRRLKDIIKNSAQ